LELEKKKKKKRRGGVVVVGLWSTRRKKKRKGRGCVECLGRRGGGTDAAKPSFCFHSRPLFSVHKPLECYIAATAAAENQKIYSWNLLSSRQNRCASINLIERPINKIPSVMPSSSICDGYFIVSSLCQSSVSSRDAADARNEGDNELDS
jgi:hypothetical protein